MGRTDAPFARSRRFELLIGVVALVAAATVWLVAAPGSTIAAGSCSLAGVKNYVGPNGGSWFSASNWSPAGVPTSTTHVCLAGANGVNIDTGATAQAASIEASAPVTVSAGQLRVNSTTQQSDIHSTIAISGGTLGGAGTVNVDGSATWSGSTLGDGSNAGSLVIAPGGTLTTSGNNSLTLGAKYTLRVNGTAHWAGNGADIYTYNQSRLIVGSGGTLSAETSRTIYDQSSGGANAPLLNVQSGGTLTKSAGAGQSTAAIPVQNDGTTSATAGALSLNVPSSGAGNLSATGGGALTIDSTYSPQAGATVSGTGVALANGSIVGAGTLTVNGTLNWTGGSGLGDGSNAGTTTVASGGTLAITGTSARYLNAKYKLHVDGSVTWAGSGTDIYAYNLAKLEVGSGGAFDAQTNQGIYDQSSGGSSSPLFSVQSGGMLTKSAGGGTSTLTVPVDNDGTANAATGTLALGGGSNGNSSSGQFSAASGAVADFSGGVHQLADGASLAGAGTVRASVATVSLAGGTSAAAGTTVDLAGGTIGGAGTLTVNGALTWASNGGGFGDGTNAGSTVIAPGGTLAISGSNASAHYLNAKYTVHIDGAATWAGSGTDIYAYNQSKIEVGSGGTFDAQTNQTIYDQSSGGANTPLLDVQSGATLTKSAAPNGGSTTIFVPIQNDGTTSATAGTLSLNTNKDTGSGNLTATAPATLAIGGTYSPQAGATVSGTGVVLTGTIGGAGTLTVNGRLNWTSGAAFGDTSNAGNTVVAPSGTLAISGSNAHYLNAKYTVHIDGAATWTGFGTDIYAYNQSKIEVGSGGTFDAQNNQTIYDQSSGGANTPQFNVHSGGTLLKSAGSSTAIGIKSTNGGTMQSAAGKLDLGSGLTNFAGDTLTGGKFVATGGSKIAVNGLDVRTNAASILLSGSTAGLVDQSNQNGLRLLNNNAAGARLELANGKNLTVPTFTNNGEVALAGSTTLTANAFTQSPTGTFTPTITGTTPGTNAGRILSNSTASLAGTLHMVTPSLPAPGDALDLITASGALSGTFGTVKGAGYSVSYTPHTVHLNAIAQTPQLSINDAAVVEGNSGSTTANLTVSLSSASGSPVTVKYKTADSSAVAPSDYAAIPSTTLTFAPGETTKTIVTTVNGDVLHEGDEGFSVGLSNPTGATIADSSGRVRILDDEGQLSAYVDDASLQEGNSGAANAQFSVRLSQAPAPGETMKVNYATANGSATTANSDYQPASGTLTFDSSTGASQAVSVPVVGDTTKEANETFKVNLSGPSNVALGDSSAVGTIVNDDVVPGPSVKPSIYISDATLLEGDAGSQTMSFAVRLSQPSASTVSVNYKTEHSTAFAPDDYTEIAPAVLTFAPGETSKTIDVTVNGDTVKELTEALKVNLTGVSNATIGDPSAAGTILDNEGPLTVGINDVRVVEGDSGTKNAAVTVTISDLPAPGQSVGANYATADGSATAPSDYSSLSGGVGFSNVTGLTRTISVPVVGDTDTEPNETFTVNLSTVKGGVASDIQGLVTIHNDD
jgi:Calx-beta domain